MHVSLSMLHFVQQGQAVEVRQSAGLLLKNNLKSGFSSIPPAYQHYIKSQLLPLIGSPDRHLRIVVGTVISVIVQHSGPASWPELWAGLAQCLEGGSYAAMEGAFDSLFKICEGDPLQMDVQVPGLPQKPVDAFLPRLIALFASPHAPLRQLAVGTVNQFVIPMPMALQVNLDGYLQGLFALANDTAGDVRRLVCAGLVSLLEVQPDALLPRLRNVIEYMLQASQDPDQEVALEACEFWSAFCEAHLPVEQLKEFLPRLMGVLLNNMEYADDDEAVLSIEDDEETVPDREEDIKPFFHHSKVQGAADGAEEEVEEDDEPVNVWNLRKCSAAGLDTLSTAFGDELLPVLMPLVQARLASQSEEKWKEREAGVLAMGAIAEGCITGLLPHLSQVSRLLVLGDVAGRSQVGSSYALFEASSG
jgi:transportin-1